MNEPGPAHDHQTLNALNEQIAAAQTRIADLERRIHVIDVELEQREMVAHLRSGALKTPFIAGLILGLITWFQTFHRP